MIPLETILLSLNITSIFNLNICSFPTHKHYNFYILFYLFNIKNNIWTNCGGQTMTNNQLVDDYGWPPKNIDFSWQKAWKTHAIQHYFEERTFFSHHNSIKLIQKVALTTFSSNYWNYFSNPQALTYVLTNVGQEYIFLHTK